jgi:hypothetical protein
MTNRVTHYYVHAQYKHHVTWYDLRPLFSSKEAAEEYAREQSRYVYGVGQWEIRELSLTSEDVQALERLQERWKVRCAERGIVYDPILVGETIQ